MISPSNLIRLNIIILFFVFLLFEMPAHAQLLSDSKAREYANKIQKDYKKYFSEWQHIKDELILLSVNIQPTSKTIELQFNQTLAYFPIRESYIDSLRNLIKNDLGAEFKNYHINIFVKNIKLEEYIPNAYRKSIAVDTRKFINNQNTNISPLVLNTDKQLYTKGLQNNHFALWHSHGCYYEAKYNHWQWQRPPLFGTVEDINTMSYIIPYLAPMLENAGAVTIIPRERDTQHNEVIVDNDGSTGESEFYINIGDKKWHSGESGFAFADTLFNNHNPFTKGSHLLVETVINNPSSLVYLPDIPESGEYAVYVSWANNGNNINNAQYTVYHLGGATHFNVNQTISAGTWVYLGKFKFSKGKNYGAGRVELSNYSKSKGIITADAVRFGGGMGNVARGASNKLSNKKRFMEAARYYLQYAGIPSSVYKLTNDNDKNDYVDDYQSRGKWVSYLMGLYKSTSFEFTSVGLNIPIDLSIALHTDAGITSQDSVVGTLAIYDTKMEGTEFPSGMSKTVNRDLTDIVQSQIVNDLRTEFYPTWTNRGLRDKPYSEIWRPKSPSALIELLSHQNITDMRLGLDPRFRFAASRAIYKGILRFQAMQEQRNYVVQPLSPDNFAINLVDGKHAKLTWSAVNDPLEPSANPKQYRVYQRVGDGGFDNGTLVNTNYYDLPLPKAGVIYSYRVTALNEGGESFPSETLAVCIQNNERKPVLVVNAFTRICAPKITEEHNAAQFPRWKDMGVPYIADIAYAGNNLDFDIEIDTAFHNTLNYSEGLIIPGNTFDFVYTHGKSIANAGYSFVSISSKAFVEGSYNPNNYVALDVIFGKQKSTPHLINPAQMHFTVFTPKMINAISKFIKSKTGIFMSGAYVGLDMVEQIDYDVVDFARKQLHYKWGASHSYYNGQVESAENKIFPQSILFNSKYSPDIYAVESCDVIEPIGNNAKTIYQYADNSSAGILYQGNNKTIIFGFPFESIIEENERNTLMKAILQVLNND